MIKLKQLITENVNVEFKENDTLLYITDQRGEWMAILWSWKKPDGQQTYHWYLGYPARYVTKSGIKVGGKGAQGPLSNNPEQVQADLMNKMKENGLPYIEAMKLKWRDLNRIHQQNDEFIQKIQQATSELDFTPQLFDGTVKDGAWITGEDVENGKLQQAVNNYGDFWLVVKFERRPRQQIKASEFIKNYDQIVANDIREVWIRTNPFGDKV